jgi:hypothetical protein
MNELNFVTTNPATTAALLALVENVSDDLLGACPVLLLSPHVPLIIAIDQDCANEKDTSKRTDDIRSGHSY